MSKKTAPQARCPTCRKKVEKEGNDFFPFCNERCQLQDLGQWLDNGYSIPGSYTDGQLDEFSENENEEGW